MKSFTLIRDEYTDEGVRGILTDGVVEFQTIERPWLDNAENISCIPGGTYRVVNSYHPKHGNSFEVLDVPDRTAILFHVANTIEDIEGCIGLGMERAVINGLPGVSRSKVAYKQFMNYMKDDEEFELLIE